MDGPSAGQAKIDETQFKHGTASAGLPRPVGGQVCLTGGAGTGVGRCALCVAPIAPPPPQTRHRTPPAAAQAAAVRHKL